MTPSNLFSEDQMPGYYNLPEQFEIYDIPGLGLFSRSLLFPFQNVRLLLLSAGVLLAPMIIYFFSLMLPLALVGKVTALLVIPVFLAMIMGMAGVMNEWMRTGLGLSQRYPAGLMRFFRGVWGNIGRLIVIGIIGGIASMIVVLLISVVTGGLLDFDRSEMGTLDEELPALVKYFFLYALATSVIFTFVLSYVFSRFGVDLVTGAMNERNKRKVQERVPFGAKLKGLFLPLWGTYLLSALVSTGVSMIPAMIMAGEFSEGQYESLPEASTALSSLSWIMLPTSLLSILLSFYIFAVFSSMFGLAFRYRFGLTDEMLQAIDRS
ncbi:hypothetical protein [Emcibacter nanhaiensis]|uniref:DUF4013 domain-containing protein n=1 Tax=Emcibacter nanhaiensis TaxID=1505037 RepID=A0A501PRI6_9PROT|nr:hypothetical protein [Emcibacter nanhaiensis]TPD63139.1 hypothetical protein FIV46_03415 [Emcibacter nanhaiensis]